MEIVEKVREFIEEECKRKGNNYGEAYFHHFIPVVNYSKKLAEGVGADVEVCEIAAWFHDIGSIVFGRDEHHITGAEIASKKLSEWGYPQEKIENVKHCIFSHRGSKDIRRETREAEVLIEADAMSHFQDLTGLFMAAFVYEKKGRREARVSVREHLENSYTKLSPVAKEIIQPKYDAAMLLFD